MYNQLLPALSRAIFLYKKNANGYVNPGLDRSITMQNLFQLCLLPLRAHQQMWREEVINTTTIAFI